MRSAAGCAYDLLRYIKPGMGVPHDGMKFTTLDVDYDTLGSINCAVFAGGGWWFNTCGLFVPVSSPLTPSWYCPTTDSWWSMKNVHLMVKLQ